MKYFLILSACILSACTATGSKEYLVSAYDQKGRLLNKRIELGSNQAGIMLVRDTLCKTHPDAIIRVHNKVNKQLAQNYQPYSCNMNS